LDAAGAEEVTVEGEGVPLWVAQGLLGIVGILAIFGVITLIVSRMVALIRKQD
jgi:hypothetical protein